MITQDQPSIFNNHPVKVSVSSLKDGQMHPGHGDPQDAYDNILEVTKNTSTVLVRTIYEERRYDIIVAVDEQTPAITADFESVIVSDALITQQPGITLSLPVADCLAVVLYDPTNHAAAIAHMGRHATVENLLKKLVQRMSADYGTNPADLLAYFSPSIKKSHYFMEYWDLKDSAEWAEFTEHKNGAFYLDLPGYNKKKLLEAGLKEENIEISNTNTATSDSYGSHFSHKIKPSKPSDRFLVSVQLSSRTGT